MIHCIPHCIHSKRNGVMNNRKKAKGKTQYKSSYWKNKESIRRSGPKTSRKTNARTINYSKESIGSHAKKGVRSFEVSYLIWSLIAASQEGENRWRARDSEYAAGTWTSWLCTSANGSNTMPVSERFAYPTWAFSLSPEARTAKDRFGCDFHDATFTDDVLRETLPTMEDENAFKAPGAVAVAACAIEKVFCSPAKERLNIQGKMQLDIFFDKI